MGPIGRQLNRVARPEWHTDADAHEGHVTVTDDGPKIPLAFHFQP